MALTYGIDSLAVINKGGGLKRQPTSTSGYYLRGDMTWAAFPTTLAPSAHVHSASEITEGTLALARIPTGTGSNQVALGNHTHLYAGSDSPGGPATTALACTGNSATATKLATARSLTIGGTARSFDGSAPLTWTLAEIGAAAASHTHSYLPLTGGELTGSLWLTATSSLRLAMHAGLNRIAYFTADGTVTSSENILTTSFSPTSHTHDTAYLKLTGGSLTGQLNLAAGATFKNSNPGWDNWKIPYFSAGEMIVGDFTVESFAPSAHQHDTSNITTGTLGVARGGTGKTSFTAYSLVLGGTTSTGALQSMGMGTARQLLASSGTGAAPQWLTADEYERFSMGGTAAASATQIGTKTGISEKLVFIDPGAETTPQTVSYFKAPAASGQEYGDRIVLYCCSGNENYKYIVVPSSTEKFCDLVGGQYTGNIEASYGNKIELVCLPKSGAKAWYVSRIALINNN